MPFELDPIPEADLEQIGDTLTDQIPEPQQHAIDQATADSQSDTGTSDSAVELDALGVPWNPELHATSATTGKGVRTAKGTWRKRKGLKGSASYLNTGAASGAKKDAEPDAAEVARATAEQQSRMVGAMVAQTMIYISAGVGGDEFLPRDVRLPGGNTYNEKDMLSQVWGDYFVAKGVVDIPPGIALLGGLSMYYLPRLREPNVRKKASGFVAWIKGKAEWIYFKWKYRKGGKPPEAKTKSGNGTSFDNLSKSQSEAAIHDL